MERDEPLRSCKRWETVKKLGEGAHGEVWLVEEIQTEQKRAKKIVNITSQKSVEEATYLKKCNHEHIIKYIEHEEVEIDSTKQLNIIMEFAEKGALSQNMQTFHEEEVAEITYQMLLALQHIHDKEPPIIHRDVKLENIFLMKDGKAKLGDFGICRLHEKTSEHKTLGKGTYATMAPEVSKTKRYDCKADIWSLGCVSSALMNGEYLITEDEVDEYKEKIAQSYPEFLSFINQTRVKDFKKRPSACDLLKHEWFKVCAEKLIEKIEKLMEQKDYKHAFKLLDYKLLNIPEYSLKFHIELHRGHHKRKHGDDHSCIADEDQPRSKVAKLDEFEMRKQSKMEKINSFRIKLVDIARCFEEDILAEDASKDFNNWFIEKKNIPDSVENLYLHGNEFQLGKELGDKSKNPAARDWCISSILFYLCAILRSTESISGSNKRILVGRVEDAFKTIASVLDRYITKKGSNNLHYLVKTIQNVFLHVRSKLELEKLKDDHITELLFWCESHLAAIYSVLGDHHEVIEICERLNTRILNNSKILAKVHHLLGAAHFNVENFRKAKKSFAQAKVEYGKMDFENQQDMITELENMINECIL